MILRRRQVSLLSETPDPGNTGVTQGTQKSHKHQIDNYNFFCRTVLLGTDLKYSIFYMLENLFLIKECCLSIYRSLYQLF